MLDNITNNDTAVIVFHSLLTKEYDEKIISIQSIKRQLCYTNHILNLAAKSLLFDFDIKAFEADMNISLDNNSNAIESEFQRWRNAGPIGKTHNFVTFIHHSTQRKEAFRSTQLNLLK